jgi:hypothetical protein
MPDYCAYIIGSDDEFQESVPLDCADDNVAMPDGLLLGDGLSLTVDLGPSLDGPDVIGILQKAGCHSACNIGSDSLLMQFEG